MKRLICGLAAMALVVSAAYTQAADVTHHQWVRSADDGTIVGRVIVPRSEGISALREAKVSLIDKDGEHVVNKTVSDKTGRFTLSGIEPGVYTLMINGKDAFACCALHVVHSNVPVADKFEIAAGTVDYNVMYTAMVRYMPMDGKTKVNFDPSTNPLTTEQATSSTMLRVAQHEGGLKGRLTQAGFSDSMGAAGSNVIIFREGVEVARAITGDDGGFQIADLVPGSYSVLGSGKHGFGYMGLELIDGLTLQSVSNETDGLTLVAQQPPVVTEFVMQVAPLPGPAAALAPPSDDDDGGAVPLEDGGFVIDGAPIGGAPSAGPSGGGGGGGGGLGGLAFGGAAIAVALANDRNQNAIVIPPPASPATP